MRLFKLVRVHHLENKQKIFETHATPVRFKKQTNKQTNKNPRNKQTNKQITNKQTKQFFLKNITRNGPFHPLGGSGMLSNSEKTKNFVKGLP